MEYVIPLIKFQFYKHLTFKLLHNIHQMSLNSDIHIYPQIFTERS